MKLGIRQELTVDRSTSIGLYLTDGEVDVLLPNNQVPDGVEIGDTVTAFVYLDSEDRPIATMRRPKAEVGHVAMMYIAAVEKVGVFLNWGLERDLLLPYRELKTKPEINRKVLVKVIVDERTNRVMATERVDRHLEETCPLDVSQDPVNAIVWRHLDGKTFLIVDHRYRSIAAPGQFAELAIGTEVSAYVTRAEEGRITVAQRPVGKAGIDDLTTTIMNRVKQNGGFLGLSDKSDPAEIRRILNVSKGDYKKAIGALMKQGLIDIEYHGIRLR